MKEIRAASQRPQWPPGLPRLSWEQDRILSYSRRGAQEPDNSGSGLSGNPRLASWVPLHLLLQRNLQGKAKQIDRVEAPDG